ncbi:MAG: MlaD family protein [Chitinophagales bacterium]|nr:MlaD family protein [Chitinophagales bacterium]
MTRTKVFAWFLMLFLFIQLSACSYFEKFNYYNIYLSFNDLNGLKVGSLIYNKDKVVGQVLEIDKGDEGGYIAKLSIKDDFLIPRNSEVRVVSDIDITTAHIAINMSHSKKNYSEDDTIISHGSALLNNNIQLEEVKLSEDSLPDGIKALMQ